MRVQILARLLNDCLTIRVPEVTPVSQQADLDERCREDFVYSSSMES